MTYALFYSALGWVVFSLLANSLPTWAKILWIIAEGIGLIIALNKEHKITDDIEKQSAAIDALIKVTLAEREVIGDLRKEIDIIKENQSK